jgi:hypothetical protein
MSGRGQKHPRAAGPSVWQRQRDQGQLVKTEKCESGGHGSAREPFCQRSCRGTRGLCLPWLGIKHCLRLYGSARIYA